MSLLFKGNRERYFGSFLVQKSITRWREHYSQSLGPSCDFGSRPLVMQLQKIVIVGVLKKTPLSLQIFMLIHRHLEYMSKPKQNMKLLRGQVV